MRAMVFVISCPGVRRCAVVQYIYPEPSVTSDVLCVSCFNEVLLSCKAKTFQLLSVRLQNVRAVLSAGPSSLGPQSYRGRSSQKNPKRLVLAYFRPAIGKGVHTIRFYSISVHNRVPDSALSKKLSLCFFFES